MEMIYKLNRFNSEKNKLINNVSNYIYSIKLKNYNSRSKNKERQRKIRIDECLADFNDYNKNNNSKVNKKFRSIMDSKMISGLLLHCRKEVKNDIISERLNNEFDWKINENEKFKNKPIKMNF